MKEVFSLIRLLQDDLVVAGVAVKKREECAPGCQVNNLVNAREREGVFRAVFVEICIVNTHSPFAISLFYKDWVCHPFWMCDFLDETSG